MRKQNDKCELGKSVENIDGYFGDSVYVVEDSRYATNDYDAWTGYAKIV